MLRTLVTQLYVFVSFSMGEPALIHYAEEAKRYDAILVLRGFSEGSYKKTAQKLSPIIEKTGQGFVIDPELFTLFDVQTVPTVILARSTALEDAQSAFANASAPKHDRLQGHVSLFYTLDKFAKSGDFQEEAKVFLRKERGI